MITKSRESQLRKYAVIISLEAIDEDVPSSFKDKYTPKTADEFQYVLTEQQNTLKQIFNAIHHKASKGELLSDVEMKNLIRGRKQIKNASIGGHTRRENYKDKYDYGLLRDNIREMIKRNNGSMSFTQARKLCAKKMRISEAAAKNHIKKSDVI